MRMRGKKLSWACFAATQHTLAISTVVFEGGGREKKKEPTIEREGRKGLIFLSGLKVNNPSSASSLECEKAAET